MGSGIELAILPDVGALRYHAKKLWAHGHLFLARDQRKGCDMH